MEGKSRCGSFEAQLELLIRSLLKTQKVTSF